MLVLVPFAVRVKAAGSAYLLLPHRTWIVQ
jgi:hypothetical protein